MSGNHDMRTHRGLVIEPSAGRKEAVEGGTRDLLFLRAWTLMHDLL